MRKFFIVILGFVFWPVFKLIPVKNNLWVFGAQNGQDYADNSKFLFEYIIEEQPSTDAVWITRSKDILKKLREKNLPVQHNLSILGLWYMVRAEVIAFSTSRSDILFIHYKTGRKIVNLWHGMPIKKIAYDYGPHKPENKDLKARVWDFFVAGFQHNEVDIIASTSPFYNEILSSSFRNNNTYVTGQPRTDVFYKWDKKAIKEELGFSEDEIIVTYMPTHRAYGAGKMNPQIFEHDAEMLNFLRHQKVSVVWKYHKNMLQNYDSNTKTPQQIVDLTKQNIDPQELLFVTDILITDYSSCYIDYLLFNRPIIFFHYDDYEKSDNALYFSIKENNPGPIVESEKELGQVIQRLILGSDSFVEQRTKYLNQYHTHQDGNSSKRVFELIISELNR